MQSACRCTFVLYTSGMPTEPTRHRQIPLTRLRASIGTVVDEVRDGSPIVVMRRGEPTAVIMSYADFKGTLGMGARLRTAAELMALVDRTRGPAEIRESSMDVIRRARDERAGSSMAAGRPQPRARRRGNVA